MSVVFFLLSLFIRQLSWAQVDRLGVMLGRLAFRLHHQKRDVVLFNLAQAKVTGDLTSITVTIFENYGRYYLELLKINAQTKTQFFERLTIDGKNHFEKALQAGKGIIIVTPHLGNWDLAGCGLTLFPKPVAAVAEVLKPASLFRWFKKTRENLGVQVIGLDAQAGKQCLKHLKQNNVLALVGDRDIQGNGLPLPFMGQMASIPKGPAQLALRTGATLMIGFCVRTGPGEFKGKFYPPLKVKKSNDFEDDVFFNTQAIATQLEEVTRAHIEQWCMLQEIHHGKS